VANLMELVMPIYELYSRRKNEAEKSQPDVYQYDKIPDPLRVQVRRILEDSIGAFNRPSEWGRSVPNNNEAWDFLRDAVAREHGKLSLANERHGYDDCVAFIHSEKKVEQWLDLVELCMRYVDKVLNAKEKYELDRIGATQTAADAVEELNTRFRQSAFGYRYESGQIVRIDSELVHAEVVRPALRLLSDTRFSGAEEEFRSAHAHYRAGEYKDCAADALNALESVLKTICQQKGWKVEKGARATDLLKVVRKNGLLPDYLDTSFDQLVGTLSSGLPKVRNEEGGHGQGAIPRATPTYIAAYALNLAAAKIVLLVEAFLAGE
jgi:hypothetical protein